MAPASHDPKRNQYGSSIKQCVYTHILHIHIQKYNNNSSASLSEEGFPFTEDGQLCARL